jgi:regulator of replication initiation timing
MALTKKYIDTTNSTEETITTKLYLDQYNSNELSKSVNLQVTELIKPLPEIRLDLIPKPIYDTELSHSADLQIQVNMLTADVDSLKARVQALMADSSSLYLDNDNLRVQNAAVNNKLGSIQKTTLDLKSNLTTSLTKAINEATERTSLEAENAGLVAQKTALIKQIDTLNNLLAQANASLQVAAQQLSAKAQAVAAGGLSTGELSTLVFDGGDPSKRRVDGKDIMNDFNGGPYGVTQKFSPGGSLAAKSLYFDVVVGPKDISVMVECIAGYKQLPFDFGFTLPITLKANQTKRFGMETPNAAWNTAYGGKHQEHWYSSGTVPTVTDWTMRITVKDIDPNGKSENKDFIVRTHKY